MVGPSLSTHGQGDRQRETESDGRPRLTDWEGEGCAKEEKYGRDVAVGRWKDEDEDGERGVTANNYQGRIQRINIMVSLNLGRLENQGIPWLVW